MTDFRARYVPPSISEAAFSCPHCGSLTTQYWFELLLSAVADSQRVPHLARQMTDAEQKELFDDAQIDEAFREQLKRRYTQAISGRPFRENHSGVYLEKRLGNVHVSTCYACKESALWLHDRLIFPVRGSAPLPNPDMPSDVLADYEEADRILNASPRGAAALLRLSIQKLCKHIGGSGKNIDDDIATFVKAGLPVRIQQSLDIVRVVGNNAVHPGQIDLTDDHEAAEKLFGLVNLIVQDRISSPKAVEQMYGSLPENSRKAIDKRDS